MEGLPRLPMLAPEMKTPQGTLDEEYLLRVKEYILMRFQADPSDFDQPLRELQHMRLEIGQFRCDVEMACVLKRYYAQLGFMKNRFPMEENDELRFGFEWLDRLLDMPNTLTYEDVNYERACVLFNISAVHAGIAAAEPRDSENSIKNAFMHLQWAAWPLQYLRDNTGCSKWSSLDFDPDMLTFYINVLLGQAQECLVEKSLLDHRSHAVIARLAAHLRDLYSECRRHVENSQLGEMVSSGRYKEWLRTCSVKSDVYGAIAQLCMGQQADEEQKYGTRLGQYQLALAHVNQAVKNAEKEKRETIRQAVNFMYDVVKAKEENAKKENDFIYHDRVPPREELLVGEGLCKVKPCAFDPLDPSVGGEDLFGALLPPSVLQAVSQYEEAKAALKRTVLQRVEKRDDELEAFIASLKLAELQLDGVPPRLPDALLERNAAFNSQPDAFSHVLDGLHKVGDEAREVESKLAELSGRLDTIESPQLTSDEGFRAIRSELKRLGEHHGQARLNNAELHKALAAHSDRLHLLGLPLHTLTQHITGDDGQNKGDSPEVAAMRRMLDKTTEMQVQRAFLAKTLSDELAADSIAKRLLAERDLDCQETFQQELSKHDQTIKYIDQNLVAQDAILHALTEANADFAEERRRRREQMRGTEQHVVQLIAAHDVFMDVSTKSAEGFAFYQQLRTRLEKLAMAVEGIEAAYASERAKRDAEKRALDEKMAALQRAREARAAMEDFGGPVGGGGAGMGMGGGEMGGGGGGGGGGGVPAARGARPRLGDYMDYYRNKMAGGAPSPRGPAPMGHAPSPQLPPHLSMPPSPTPSSVSSFQMSPVEGSPAPHPWQQHAPMPHHSLPPVHMPARQPYAPPYQAPPPQHHYSHSPSPHLNSHHATPTPPPQQHAPPPHAPPPQHYQGAAMGYQYPPSQPVYQQYVPPTSMGGGQGYAPPPPMQQAPPPQGPPPSQMQAPPSQAPPTHHVPAAPMQALPPQPLHHSASGHSLATNRTQPSLTSVPSMTYQQQHMGYQVPPSVNHGQPLAPPPPVSQAHSQSPFRPIQPPQQQSAAGEAPLQQPVPHLPQAAGPPPVPHQQYYLPQQPVQHTYAGYSGGAPVQPPATPVSTAPAPAPAPAPVQPAPQPAQQPQYMQQPSSFDPTQSPFHSSQSMMGGGTASPWHRGAGGGGGGAAPMNGQWNGVPQQQHHTPAPTPAPAPPMQNGVQYQNGAAAQPAPPPQQQASNVDLLSSLLGDLQLPPPLQPATSVSAQQQQPAQKEAAPLLPPPPPPQQQSSQAVQAPQPQQQQRPAAAVQPIPQQQQPVVANQPNLHMMGASTVCYPTSGQQQSHNGHIASNPWTAQHPQPLAVSDVMDASKFEVGPGDKAKLEKRQLHEAIRAGGTALPPKDPRDPLNQLDPFWKQ